MVVVGAVGGSGGALPSKGRKKGRGIGIGRTIGSSSRASCSVTTTSRPAEGTSSLWMQNLALEPGDNSLGIVNRNLLGEAVLGLRVTRRAVGLVATVVGKGVVVVVAIAVREQACVTRKKALRRRKWDNAIVAVSFAAGFAWNSRNAGFELLPSAF